MVDLDLLQILANYGPGLFIAFMVLVWKRADDQRYAGALERNAQALEALNGRLLSTLEANTEALGQLRAVLDTDAMVDRLERKLNQRDLN